MGIETRPLHSLLGVEIAGVDRVASTSWRLDPVRLAESGGFGRAEIRRVESLVRDRGGP